MKNDIILETLETILNDRELTEELVRLKDVSSIYEFFHSLNNSISLENLKEWMEKNMINDPKFDSNKLGSKDLESIAGGISGSAGKATKAALLSAMMVLGNSGFLSNSTSHATFQNNVQYYKIRKPQKNKPGIFKKYILPALPVAIPLGAVVVATGGYILYKNTKGKSNNQDKPDPASQVESQHTSTDEDNRNVVVASPFVGLINKGNTCFANAYLQLLDSIYGSFSGNIESILSENNEANNLESHLDTSINFIEEKLDAAKNSIKTDEDFQAIYNIFTSLSGNREMAWAHALMSCSFSGNAKYSILDNFYDKTNPLAGAWSGFAQNFKTIFLESEEYYGALKENGYSQENINSIKEHARNLETKLRELDNLYMRCEDLINYRRNLEHDVTNNGEWRQRAQHLLNIFNRMHQNQQSGSIDVGDFTKELQQSRKNTQEDPTDAFNNYLSLYAMLPHFIQGIGRENANNWHESLPKYSNLLGKGFLVSLNRNLTIDPDAKNRETNLPEEITSEDGKKYRLKGIVCHLGGTIDWGHYVAHRWDENSNSWWQCNDSSVTQEHVNASKNSNIRKAAYLLAYERVAD